MMRRITLASVVAMGCMFISTSSYAATAAAITNCVNKGTRLNAGKFIDTINKNISGCVNNIAKGKLPPATDCLGDAIAEFGSTTPSAAYAGKMRKALDGFHKKLAAACYGEDKVPYTADDVTLAELNANPSNGVNLKGYGGELVDQHDFNLLTDLNGTKSPAAVHTRIESVMEEDCIATEPIHQYAAKPQLQKLLDTYQCLTINEGIAKAKKGMFLDSPALSLYKAEVVKAPVRYDAGADLMPAGAPNGINDTPNIPASSSCPKPGIGACAANPNVTCSLTPGSGSDPANAGCPPYVPCGGCPLCVEALTGPDGVKPGDNPGAGTLTGGKCITEVTATKATIKCVAEGIGNPGLVTTVAAGTCSGGPSNGAACDTSNPNSPQCDTQIPSRYGCLSGDEYSCQIQSIGNSNDDNSPTCGPCLAALIGGPAGSGCGVGGGALCVVATCSGGGRNGQLCDITGLTACPGGFCNGVGSPTILTGDEVGFFAPAFGGMGYFLCDFQSDLSFPMEVVGGVGTAIADVRAAPISVCLPPGARLQAQGCYIHQPGVATTALVGLFTNATPTKSDSKIPCPEVSFPLPGSATGLPTYTGVGPIIGVGGAGR